MSKKQTSDMTHIMLVNENKPRVYLYNGTEGKKLPRPCLKCGVVVQGNLRALEQHHSANHPKVELGFDYTNQAWIQDGVYLNCAHPLDHGCRCYGRLHEGEAPEVGASIHF
jgi:hypothetical protein